jgi:niacin transporter
MRTAEVALAGMLSALSIAIPLVFRGTPLQIYIPALQYSGTVASHVPSMLAIAVGPVAAVVVGLASTIGFAATLGPIVAARAFTHVIWGLAAAIYVSRGGSYVKGLLLVALPIHAVGEGIVVFALGPLFGAIQVAAETAGLLVFAGTLIHHLIDSVISIAVLRVVKPLLVPLLPHLAHTKLVWSVAIRKGPLASFVRRRKVTVFRQLRGRTLCAQYGVTGSGQ